MHYFFFFKSCLVGVFWLGFFMFGFVSFFNHNLNLSEYQYSPRKYFLCLRCFFNGME